MRERESREILDFNNTGQIKFLTYLNLIFLRLRIITKNSLQRSLKGFQRNFCWVNTSKIQSLG